jgi:hypothetical protein
MYLAKIRIDNQINYVIRTSVKKDNYYIYINLFNLGKNPLDYVIFCGRSSFYIDERVIDTINQKGIKTDQIGIEHIFIPFLPWEITSLLASFNKRDEKRKKISNEDFKKIHAFDKFRLYHLKFQDQKQFNLNKIPINLFSVLTDKSRDELETFFEREEKKLHENEIKNYLFSAFNLQFYFTGPLKKQYPELCPEKDLDKAFIEQLCNLNKDSNFIKGVPPFKGLNDYLKRYAWMFFDFDFNHERINQEIFKNFINKNRKLRTFFNKPKKEVFLKSFGKSYEELKEMNKEEIKKIFRKKAKKLHPDKGGNKKDFHNLCACYRSLIDKN